MSLFTKQKQTHRLSEQIYDCQRGKVRGGMNQEFRINRYTLLISKTDKQQSPTLQLPVGTIQYLFLVFLPFLGPLLLHMEFPGQGSNQSLTSSLHQSHSNAGSSHFCKLHHSSQQCPILNPLSKARDQTCVFMDPSLVR